MAPNYVGPFVSIGRVFAPRYRQASLYTLMTLRDDAREARRFAYGDVAQAFRYYVAHYNQGRPFVIVGVEQGGTLATRLIAEEVAAGRLSPNGITERTIARHLYVPELPEVDLFLRSSGEQRTSNFMLWQSAYAEMVFLDTLWPDFDRRELWRAIEIYQDRDRRFGGAVDKPNAAQ